MVDTAKGIRMSILTSLLTKTSSITGLTNNEMADLDPAITTIHTIAINSLNH
jgi:hypothetical protein